MLDDAAQIPVVLQDMEDRRAWLSNAETMILHIAHHRNTVKPYVGEGFGTYLRAGSQDDPLSIRRAMLSNRNMVLNRPDLLNSTKDRIFEHHVSDLFSIFEGLEGVQEEITRDTGKELKFGDQNHLYGWEYLDIVNRKRHPQIRSTQLRKICGGWPRLARELNAITLFGVRFGEVMQPNGDYELCSAFKTMPLGKDYLAMEVAKLHSLYEETGSHEPGNLAQITLFGTQLQQSEHLFEPCSDIPEHSKSKEGNSTCSRVQQLMFKKNDTNIALLQDVECSGAIIIGQRDASWRDRFRSAKTKKPQPRSSPSPRSPVSPKCTMPKSTAISQATTARQDTLVPTVSIQSQNSTSSSVYTQTPSSSGSGSM